MSLLDRYGEISAVDIMRPQWIAPLNNALVIPFVIQRHRVAATFSKDSSFAASAGEKISMGGGNPVP